MKIRGTTSGSASPHYDALTVSNNTSRYVGRPRPPLLLFQAGHSGRYFGGSSHCLAPTGSSLAENGSRTCSHHCVYGAILTNQWSIVKYFASKNCKNCPNRVHRAIKLCYPRMPVPSQHGSVPCTQRDRRDLPDGLPGLYSGSQGAHKAGWPSYFQDSGPHRHWWRLFG